MIYVVFGLIISIILQIYIVSMCFCYDRCNVIFRWFNVFVFISLFIFCFYVMDMFNDNVFSLCYIFVSLFFVIYVFLVFVWFFINRNRYISLFSVKGALDRSCNGIMFFDQSGLLFLINSSMEKLLCSLGIPVMFTNVLAMNDLSTLEYVIYMGLYLIFFLIDDILIFVIAMKTLKIKGISNKYTKYSHLIGGVIMVLLGILMVIKPEWLMFNF